METAMIVHLGRTVSGMDAKQAAHENRIVACLQERGHMRENDVKLYTAAILAQGAKCTRQPLGIWWRRASFETSRPPGPTALSWN
jgi:hypothetical protein